MRTNTVLRWIDNLLLKGIHIEPYFYLNKIGGRNITPYLILKKVQGNGITIRLYKFQLFLYLK